MILIDSRAFFLGAVKDLRKAFLLKSFYGTLCRFQEAANLFRLFLGVASCKYHTRCHNIEYIDVYGYS